MHRILTHSIILTNQYGSFNLSDSLHSDNFAKQLYLASENGRDQEVLELLQRGAPPNNSDYYTREHDGYTPLHISIHILSAELLIKFGAVVAAAATFGSTPLHKACVHNRKATAKLLLEHHSPTRTG